MTDTSAPLAGYARERAELVEGATPGLAAAAALTRATDEAVAALTATASSALSRPFAIVALGGYGAGHLFPGSDIDLLIVGDLPRDELEALTRRVLYPLWDLGLDVGHQVRTPRDHLRAVKDDLTILTASLTGRFVAGDEMLATRVIRDVRTWARKRRRRLIVELLERERPGSPYLLEPDLKAGAGGQRDLDELTWRAVARGHHPDGGLAGLVEDGVLDREGLARLASAREVLAATRWSLDSNDGGSRNLLTLESSLLPGIDAPLLQRALADIHHTFLDAREADHDRRAEPGTWTASRLVAAAAAGPASLPRLERAAWSGALDDLVPGFADLLSLRRPALTHRWTVGAHSLRVATAISHDPDGFTEQVLATLPDPSPLIVAALTHDIGKRDDGPDHAAVGAGPARETARRFGLTTPLAWATSTLVKEHLLLSDTVSTRDLTDEDTVLRTASRIGDRSLVGPLYLLTRADMIATGPDVWTPWRATLIRELTTKLDAALSDEVDGAGIAAAAAGVRDAALEEAARAGMERPILRFLEQVPLRYLANRDVAEVLRHARLTRELRGPLGPTGLAIDVATGAAPDTWRVSVMAADREGLFGMIAGVLSLADLDILAAEAFTETSGIALDVFTVTGASHAPVEHDRWARFERMLRAALAGGFDISARLSQRRRHYRIAKGTTEVRVESVGPLTTIVRVQTPDRVGLLHDLASTIRTAGFDIRLAAARTGDGIASDVFHLVDADGSPPREDVVLDRLRDGIIASSPGSV